MLKNKDEQSAYEEWANKLQTVYQENAQKITDAYTESASNMSAEDMLNSLQN